MAGPSPAYLAALQAGLPPVDLGDVDAPAAYQPNPGAPNYNPNPAQPPRRMASFARDAAPIDIGDIDSPANAVDIGDIDAPAVPVRTTANSNAGHVPANDDGPGLDPTQVEYRTVGGGVTPAGEAYMRGPKQNAHMMAAFDEAAAPAGPIRLRNELQAREEADLYERQADAAIKRQEAAERVAIRRQQEMQAQLADYNDSIAKLGTMHLDQNRWWGNQSTGDKIANTLLVFASGFFGGGNGAFDRISKQIDQDIEAQKFDYNAAVDQARGKQTAYGMLLDKYQSEDAATAAARAAALDYTAMKAEQMRAQWKGAESQNQIDQFLAKLAADRENTIAAGFRFIPAQASAPKYQMAYRGHVAPGLFSEKEAQANFLKYQTEPAQKTDETITKGEVDAGVGSFVARAKASAEQTGKADEGAKHIAQMLQTAGIPLAKQAALTAKEALNASPGSLGERIARATTPDATHDYIMSEDSNAREQAWQDFANQAMKVTMGNVTDQEKLRADIALGNKSPAARKRALENTLRALNAEEDNAMASASPAAQAQYRAQKSAAAGSRKEAAKLPPSATLHGKK